MLKECSSLDVNDFLHDDNPYMMNRPLPPYHATAIASSQGVPSTSAPPVQLVEIEIFHNSHERRLPQYLDISNNEPYIGTSFGQGSGGFNQFKSMERALSGSVFFSNLDLSAFHGSKSVSLSQGYKSQQRRDAGAPRPLHSANRTRHQRFMQRRRSACAH